MCINPKDFDFSVNGIPVDVLDIDKITAEMTGLAAEMTGLIYFNMTCLENGKIGTRLVTSEELEIRRKENDA